MNETLIKIAKMEILHPTNNFVKDELHLHELVYEDSSPVPERVGIDDFATTHAVYFKVKEQPYFFAIYINKESLSVNGAGTENGNQIYFTATSEQLSLEEMSNYLSLSPLTGWNKGDLRRSGKSRHSFSRLIFDPFESNAYDFEGKLRILLEFLQNDHTGIKRLAKHADTYISASHYMFVGGNKGLVFPANLIQRIHNLNLGMSIEQGVYGPGLDQ